MPIPYFAEHQNDVFVPALIAALVATVLLTTPVVLAPLLGRIRARRALTATVIVLGAVALVVAVVEAGSGFRVLDTQHANVRRAIADRYGLQLRDDEVSRLIEGGTLQLTEQGVPTKVKLTPAGGDEYVLTAPDGTRVPGD